MNHSRTTVLIFLLIWFLCGIVNYGMLLPDMTYWDGNEKLRAKYYRQSQGAALLLSFVWGPFGTPVYFCLTGFCEHGFRFR